MRFFSLFFKLFGISKLAFILWSSGILVTLLSGYCAVKKYKSHKNFKEQKKAIKQIEEKVIKEGQDQVDLNIDYLKELDKKNKLLLKNKDKTQKKEINKETQEKAKEKHFKQLEGLLK